MAKKKHTLTKRDICEMYDIKPQKLEYHITKTTTKRSPHAFPEGVMIGGKRHYNKAEVAAYAKSNTTFQKPSRTTNGEAQAADAALMGLMEDMEKDMETLWSKHKNHILLAIAAVIVMGIIVGLGV